MTAPTKQAEPTFGFAVSNEPQLLKRTADMPDPCQMGEGFGGHWRAARDRPSEAGAQLERVHLVDERLASSVYKVGVAIDAEVRRTRAALISAQSPSKVSHGVVR